MRQSTQPLGKSAADRLLQGQIEGKRRRGRPRKSWIDPANPSQRLEPWPSQPAGCRHAVDEETRRCNEIVCPVPPA